VGARGSEQILDEYLVAAAVAGDADALDRLIARWQPRFVRHAWRVQGDAERARDAVQDAWVEILRGLPGLQDVAAFPAWAFRIVTRRCQRISSRRSARPISAETSSETMPEPCIEATGEQAAEVARMMEVLRALPAAQRATLALFYLEDLSVAEIAVALDVPPGTVKTRLMHARRKMREQLEGAPHGQDR
jgi:RNA polymerase sigma factor (sigma-70 family)